MIKFFFFIVIFLPSLAYSQDRVKVAQKDSDKYYTDSYYVLKSNKKIKDGNYQKTYRQGLIAIDGFYKNGLKDSVWTEYYWGGVNIKKRGYYSHDLKSGVWEFYDTNGQLLEKYNYTTKRVVFDKHNESENEREFRVVNGKDTITTKLDTAPHFIGGEVFLEDFLIHNIKYPSASSEKGISGKVLLTFIIDTSGQVTGLKIKQSVSSDIDEEALRVLKLTSGDWAPGILNGKMVNVEYVFPVMFSVE